MLTFRRSVGLQREGIKFAVNVGGLQSHLTTGGEGCCLWHHDSAYTRWDDVTRCQLAYFAVLRKVILTWSVKVFAWPLCALPFWVPPQNWVSWSINDGRWTVAYQRWQLTKIGGIQLCLNENGKGKAVPMLIQASFHENTWQIEGRAPGVHNLGARWLVGYQPDTLILWG